MSGYGMVLFAGTDSGVFRSNVGDVRIGWAPINTGLTNTLVRALVYIFDGSDENDGIGANDLFVGTSGGGVFLFDRWRALVAEEHRPDEQECRGAHRQLHLRHALRRNRRRRRVPFHLHVGRLDAGQQRPVEPVRAGSRRRGDEHLCGDGGWRSLLSTNDGQGRWTAVNSGMPNLAITALATDGTNLFVATGAGVFRRPLAEMISR